ncbi:MAG: lectin-like protein, partial [Xenococcus sp. (in: cyanobacteria)]
VNKSFASGGSLIRNNVNNQSISGTTTFTGQTGVYNIIIGYHDLEIDDGEIKFKLNGNIIDTWQLTKDLEDHTLKAENFTTHIISNVSLTTNESFTLESIVSEDDYGEGSLDYIEFVPVADNTPSNDLVLGQDPIVIEAENMTLSGGYYPDNEYYNGTVIRTSSGNPNGVASSTFTGETGYYQVVVRYIDEHDGNASLSVKIANTEIDNWVLNKNTGSVNQYYTRTISEVMYIDANATIEIQGQAESWEFARVDYIEFIPVEPPATNDSSDSSSTDVDAPRETTSITPELELGENSDVLRGGAANDGIDGGAGNDIIFGEDELNDSSNISPVLVDDGIFQYGHSTYFLTSPDITWEEAQAEAQSYGGNLVTINDAAEESWLEQTFGNSEFWIGLTDKENEGTFKWASGEAVTYTNWVPSEANDGNGSGSDYVRMNMDSIDVRWGDHVDNQQLPGIIEITWSSVGGNDTIFGGAGDDQVYGNSGNDLIYGDHHANTNTPPIPQGAITHNGSAYLLTDSTMTWDEAQAQAQSLGGNLVTINDAAENQWLKDTFGTTEALFIGLSDAETEGTWKWASGEVPNWVLGQTNNGIYADWTPGEPDDYNGNQDYAILSHIWLPDTDQWDDVTSNDQHRGIIEIKLPTAASGNDNLFGNGGHDIIKGGAGNDEINGTDGIVAGYLERDILEGGADADKFILGDETQAFYATGGAQDYAVIQDFDSSEDIVQLYGVAGDYQQQQQGNDTHLTRNGDLIAILENHNNTLNLNGSAFEYVSTV